MKNDSLTVQHCFVANEHMRERKKRHARKTIHFKARLIILRSKNVYFIDFFLEVKMLYLQDFLQVYLWHLYDASQFSYLQLNFSYV